jgi:Flp pilus assembly protein TadD
VQPKVLLARHYLSQSEPAKVPSLMLELSEKQRQSAAVLEVMALAQLAQQQYPEAKYGLQQLIKQHPDFAQTHFLLAQAYAGLGERAGMRRELERTVELAPRDAVARLALARTLLLVGDKEKTAEQLAVLNELSSEHPGVLRLRASLARVEGDQETASSLLEDVFETSPSTASMLSVARQKWSMGEQAAAVVLQEQWAEEHPDDLAAKLALAGSYGQQDQVELAIAQYQRVLQKDKQNVAALNGLAWHLRNTEPAKALEYAERAAELEPDSALVMDTLAVIQLKNGQVQRAKRSIERVYQKKPNEPAVRYHRAMIDAAAGDKVAAIEALQALLGEGGDFAEKAEAQQLLVELQAGG